MTTLDSSSGVESSSMDDNSFDHHRNHRNHHRIHRRIHRLNGGVADEDDEVEEEEEGDREIWKTISKSFRQVQTVLDQNRILIQQVNENHQSKIPENLAKNVALIREINVSFINDLVVVVVVVVVKSTTTTILQFQMMNAGSVSTCSTRRRDVRRGWVPSATFSCINIQRKGVFSRKEFSCFYFHVVLVLLFVYPILEVRVYLEMGAIYSSFTLPLPLLFIAFILRYKVESCTNSSQHLVLGFHLKITQNRTWISILSGEIVARKWIPNYPSSLKFYTES